MAVAMTPTLQALDWCGSALGLLGAYTLAFRLGASRYGWLAFFAANVIYIVMASSLGVPGLLAQQIGFLGSSAIGIYRHFVSRTREQVDSVGSLAYRISERLSQISPDLEARLPPEVALLVLSARRLHCAAPGERLAGVERLAPSLRLPEGDSRGQAT